jgi:centrin-3
MGFKVKKAEVLQLLERHNEGDASSIALPAFKAICGEKLHARSPEEEYKMVFQLLSYQTAGVSAENLQESAAALGLAMSEDESAEMIAEFDADQDGILNELEFAGVFKAVEKF